MPVVTTNKIICPHCGNEILKEQDLFREIRYSSYYHKDSAIICSSLKCRKLFQVEIEEMYSVKTEPYYPMEN